MNPGGTRLMRAERAEREGVVKTSPLQLPRTDVR
jgi:hypothetical protein